MYYAYGDNIEPRGGGGWLSLFRKTTIECIGRTYCMQEGAVWLTMPAALCIACWWLSLCVVILNNRPYTHLHAANGVATSAPWHSVRVDETYYATHVFFLSENYILSKMLFRLFFRSILPIYLANLNFSLNKSRKLLRRPKIFHLRLWEKKEHIYLYDVIYIYDVESKCVGTKQILIKNEMKEMHTWISHATFLL